MKNDLITVIVNTEQERQITLILFFAEYFLEDCIQMTNFVPPPMDRKKKDKDEEGGEDDVSPESCSSLEMSEKNSRTLLSVAAD